MDPAEVRRKNLLPKFTEPHTTAFGAVYDSGDYAAALDKALAAAGYADLREEQAKRRAAGDAVQLGIGVSCYVEITGPGMEEGGPRENADRRGPSRRQRHDSHRHLPARAGPRHRVGDAGQRRARHPG